MSCVLENKFKQQFSFYGRERVEINRQKKKKREIKDNDYIVINIQRVKPKAISNMYGKVISFSLSQVIKGFIYFITKRGETISKKKKN